MRKRQFTQAIVCCDHEMENIKFDINNKTTSQIASRKDEILNH